MRNRTGAGSAQLHRGGLCTVAQGRPLHSCAGAGVAQLQRGWGQAVHRGRWCTGIGTSRTDGRTGRGHTPHTYTHRPGWRTVQEKGKGVSLRVRAECAHSRGGGGGRRHNTTREGDPRQPARKRKSSEAHTFRGSRRTRRRRRLGPGGRRGAPRTPPHPPPRPLRRPPPPPRRYRCRSTQHTYTHSTPLQQATSTRQSQCMHGRVLTCWWFGLRRGQAGERAGDGGTSQAWTHATVRTKLRQCKHV